MLLFFSIFSNLFACRAFFCLFLNSLSLLLVAILSNKLSFSKLSLHPYIYIFMTVVSVSELTGLTLVTDANPGLHSIMWIAKFNASATACVTIASAHDPGVTYKLNTLTTYGLYYFLIHWTPILRIFMSWLGESRIILAVVDQHGTRFKITVHVKSSCSFWAIIMRFDYIGKALFIIEMFCVIEQLYACGATTMGHLKVQQVVS